MNKFDFNKPGGFPLETEVLSMMQEAYMFLQNFGEIAGEKTIISGCEDTGNSVSDGVVYLNGELYFFKGGLKQNTVVIETTLTNGNFEDGQSRPIHTRKIITFGNTSGAINWSEFKRIHPITSALYIGKIDLFHGNVSDIPAGFYLCDGSNGTADLRGRFIVGMDPRESDYNTIGKTGGTKTINILKANLPDFNVLVSSLRIAAKTLTGKYIGQSGDGYPDGSGDRTTPGTNNSYPRTASPLQLPEMGVTGTININGGEQPIDSRPPYYTLAYIEYRGI